jgi:hypothetical protein
MRDQYGSESIYYKVPESVFHEILAYGPVYFCGPEISRKEYSKLLMKIKDYGTPIHVQTLPVPVRIWKDGKLVHASAWFDKIE